MPKSVWDLLLYSLEDLDDAQFKKFTRKLIDSRKGIRKADVQGKDREDVSSKLIDKFTKQCALGVTVQLLKELEYNQAAKDLEKGAAANGYSLSTEAGPSAPQPFLQDDTVIQSQGSGGTAGSGGAIGSPPGHSAPQPFLQDDAVTQFQGSGGTAGSGGATGSPPGGLDQPDSCSMLISSDLLFKEATFRDKGQEVYPVLEKGVRKRLALLINNIEFDVKKMRRNGALCDGVNMEKLLRGLGYEVVKYINLSGQEIDEAVKSFAGRPEHAESDSTFVVIMSHGMRDKILGVHYKTESKTKPDIFPIDNIYTHLNTANCPALKDKPKVILIQACRGDEDGSAWVDVESDDWEHKEKDFGALFSCTPDNKSYRNPETGALFIKFLVEVFNANAHKNDVEDLFRQIMRRFEGFKGVKQMVCKDRTTMGKLFYLFPGL